MSEKNKSALKTVSFMMIITLFGKILGLLRDVTLASNFGSSMEANAFMSASRIPRLFFDAVFAAAISSSFIPVFNEILEKKGKKEAFSFSNCFVSMVIVFTFLMTVFGILTAPYLTKLIAGQFNPKTAVLCTQLLRVMFPTVLFTGIAYSFVGILQSMDEFSIPAALSIVSNGVIILYLLFFSQTFGVFGLAAAFLIGWAMQVVIQVPPLYKRGYRFRFRPDFRQEGMKKVVVLMIPVMVSTWIQPINVAINTNFASGLFDGSAVSTIEYANTLYTMIVGVFVLSIANVIFPELSRLTTNQDEKRFASTVHMTIKVMAFILIPMMVGLMCLSTPLIRLIYQRGDFTAFDTALTSRALFFFSLGMFGYGVQTILSRAFYARQDGKTPFISGVASIAANIILCFLLVKPFDVAGLAFASAMSSTVSALVLWVPMARKNKGLMDRQTALDILKMVACAAVMAALVIVLRNALLIRLPDTFFGRIMVVGVPTAAGVLVYMVLTRLLGLQESRMVFDIIIKFVNKFRDR